MIRSSQFLRVTLRLLGATFFALACLHTSAAIDVQKAKRSRYANLDGDTIGLLDPPEECSDFYGMPHEDDCDHAVDRMPFGLLRFDESPASITNTEFLDRNTARRHLSLPYARFPQTWTVGLCPTKCKPSYGAVSDR